MTVTLKNHGLFHVAEETLAAEQLELYRAYRDTSGNMPLLFGGGSFDATHLKCYTNVVTGVAHQI